MNMRGLSLALLLLLAVGVLGYVAMNPFHLDKRPVVTTPIHEATAPPSAEKLPAKGKAEDEASGVRADGDWLIVTASFTHDDASAVQVKRSVLERGGFAATVIDTNKYPLLTPNLWAVVVGPYESRDKANTALLRVRTMVPDAYVKRAR